MLTSITIENFKGIKGPVTIPIRPLTIMFGKNSAGKSTVIQALHYAREALLNNNPNADLSELGGSSVDLGGFESIVYSHDTSRKIRIRFDMDIKEEMYDLDEKMDPYEVDPENPDDRLNLDEIASLEFTVSWSEARQTAIVTRYETSLFGVPAELIETTPDGRDSQRFFNSNHIFFRYPITRKSETDAPVWLGYIPVESSPMLIPPYGSPGMLPNDFDHYVSDEKIADLLIAPHKILVDLLSELRYIGPIREMPSRNFSPNYTEKVGDWASGIAAWRRLALADDEDDIIRQTSEVLGSDGLKTGYILKQEQFREVPSDSRLSNALINGDTFENIDDTSKELRKYPIRRRLSIVDERSGLKFTPNDIGIGISQVIPVVVAALDARSMIVSFEQPELHLHPAVQAELGDLMIRRSLRGENTFFIETHSEHLILRVLRRIRETDEGEQEEGSEKYLLPEDISLLFVGAEEGGTTYLSIPITNEGDFEKNVPGGFFAERAEELF